MPIWMLAVALAGSASELRIAGVRAEIPSGIGIQTVPWDDGGTAFAHATGPGDAHVKFSIRAGSGESLQGFRQDHVGWRFQEAGFVTVCGQQALLIEATAEPEHITCIEYSDGSPSSPGYLPPGKAYSLLLLHERRPVRITWSARSDDLAAWEADRLHFFNSVQCESPGVRR